VFGDGEKNELIVHGPPPPIPNFTYKMKIFLGFLQIATNLGLGLEIQWPTLFTEVLQYLDVINLENIMSNVTSSDCVSAINYFNKYLLICIAPLILLLLVTIFYLLPKFFNVMCFKHASAAARIRSKMNFWKLFLYALFLVYPGVSSTVLRHYMCKDLEDRNVLLADMTVDCDSSKWKLYATGSIPLVLIYPIGIPLFFFYLLRSNLTFLADRRIIAQLGFLYAGYNLKQWWFEILDCVHKIFITSLVALVFPRDWQLPTACAGAIAYLIVILVVNPYIRASDDRLHQLAQVEIFLMLLSGYVFRSLPVGAFTEREDVLVSILMLGVFFFFCGFFVYFSGKVVFASIRSFKRSKQKALEKAQKKHEVHAKELSDQSFSEESAHGSASGSDGSSSSD
jgi:hypothetical protein